MNVEDEFKEWLIYNTEFINYDMIDDNTKENVYYPKLFRYFKSDNYYSSLSDDIIEECAKTRNDSLEMSVIELYDWLNENEQYKILCDYEKLELLVNRLKL